MSTRAPKKLLDAAVNIAEKDVYDADSIGFLARFLVQTTIPHSNQNTLEFTRENGNFHLSMTGIKRFGLPYGSIPRLILSFLTTEAVKTKRRDVELGNSFSAFLAELGMSSTGGRWGTNTQVKNQLERLLSSTIVCSYKDEQQTAIKRVSLSDDSFLWWDPKKPNQQTLWSSRIELSERFFELACDRPVPIDNRALKALSRSPLAIDLYIWTTWRRFNLKRPLKIGWPTLMEQFGSSYPCDPQGIRNFRKALDKASRKVCLVYPDLKILTEPDGFILMPGKTAVSMLTSL